MRQSLWQVEGESDSYREEEYFSDVLRVTGGQTQRGARAPRHPRLGVRILYSTEVVDAMPSGGRLIAHQSDQIAYWIVDAKAIGQFMPSVFPPIEAHSLEALARQLDLPVDQFSRTVAAFNRSVQPGRFDHFILDDCRTSGVSTEKSHWARPIDTPPFLGYPLRPGITFTYLGVKVDERWRVDRVRYGQAGRHPRGVSLLGCALICWHPLRKTGTTG